MASLGEIILKFGATGEDGEVPLRFQTGHINLLVGPNNAGKSLLLRELSGVTPRVKRNRFLSAPEFSLTRIVEMVHWDEKTANTLRAEVVAHVFASAEPAWAELRSKTWNQLLPALEQAVTQLDELRDELCAALFELARTHLDEELRELVSGISGVDGAQYGPALIGLAVVMLLVTRTSSVALNPSTDVAMQTHAGPLTPMQAAAVERILEPAWGRCQAVLESLGVDTGDLSFAQLVDPETLGGPLLSELAKIPILNQVIARESRLANRRDPSAANLARFRRFSVVGNWLLDSKPLVRLAKALRETYAGETWAAPERRAQIAKRVLYLDGLARLQMTRAAPLDAFKDDDDDEKDKPPILVLLRKPELMQELRALTVDALDAYLVIDIVTRTPEAIWRLAQEEPGDGLENSYSDAADQYHRAAAPLAERSDGIHAFIGMLAAILAKPTDLVCLDEPEAFLHPPLIRKLARQLAIVARESDRQFFIATHSADLLESCVAVGADVNIIRLTHDSERSTARLLDSASLRQLALDPLLRSEATLSALFHDGAVICESAGDRVLYQEVNERLLAHTDDGLDSCVFLNAQNWQTVGRMMAPLRKMGVAAAAVLDADVLFGVELGTILEAAQVDRIVRDGWLNQRSALQRKLAARLGLELKKTKLKGDVIAALTRGELKTLRALRSAMARYGVFLVPVGELEDWLYTLGLKRIDDKGRWLRLALDRLGLDPQSETYVRPAQDDIWEFVSEVNEWILDPEREGTSPTPHQD